jgi:hypothetical protein
MTIHAHTQTTGTLPAYVNVSEHPSIENLTVLTVRSQGENRTSSIPLGRAELVEMQANITRYLNQTK